MRYALVILKSSVSGGEDARARHFKKVMRRVAQKLGTMADGDLGADVSDELRNQSNFIAPKGLLCRGVQKIVFRLSVRASVRPRVPKSVPVPLFAGPKTEPFRSRREDECVSMVFELFEVT